MRPQTWNPPIELSPFEQKIVKLIKRAKLFVFLREIRHLLFEEAILRRNVKDVRRSFQRASSCSTSTTSVDSYPTSLYEGFRC